jgi:hypothetical protein
MKSLRALLPVVLVSACQTGVVEPRTKPIDGGLASGTYDCRVAGGPTKYPLCNDVPIVVLDDQGACSVLVPYRKLFVHGMGGPNAFVSWTLHAPSRYRFIANSVKFTGRPDTRPPPSEVYVDEQVLANGSTIRVRLTAQPAPTTFDHVVVVVDTLDNNKPCKYIDPIIHNDAN